MLIDFRERGRERETSTSNMCPDGGSNLPPRYVPWPGIEHATFGVQDNTPTNWPTLPGQDKVFIYIWKLSAGVKKYSSDRSTDAFIDYLSWLHVIMSSL